MKPIDDESEDTIKGVPADAGTVNKPESAERGTGIEVSAPVHSPRAEECRSITIYGCGDQSGSDINNAMSLAGFYGRMLKADYERRRRDESDLAPVNPLLVGIPVGVRK